MNPYPSLEKRVPGQQVPGSKDQLCMCGIEDHSGLCFFLKFPFSWNMRNLQSEVKNKTKQVGVKGHDRC